MLNLDVLRDIVGDDPALLKDMLDQFIETTQQDMQNLKDAVAAGNARDVASLAHRIKGSCFVVGATELAGLANTLEQEGREGDMAGFSDMAGKMAQAFHQVLERIETLH